MLRTHEILKLIGPTAAGTSTMNKGGAAFLANKGSGARDRHTPAQRQFLADVQSQSASVQEQYRHPADGPQPHRKDGPLSPVEVAWLQGLPRDPKAVTTTDVQHLYAMSRTVGSADSPDARLVGQWLGPVAAHHDRKAADVAVANAHAPLPDIPSSTLNALADSIAHENNQLRPGEALSRARDMIAETHTKRVAARDAQIAKAEHASMTVDAKEVSRTHTDG